MPLTFRRGSYDVRMAGGYPQLSQQSQVIRSISNPELHQVPVIIQLAESRPAVTEVAYTAGNQMRARVALEMKNNFSPPDRNLSSQPQRSDAESALSHNEHEPSKCDNCLVCCIRWGNSLCGCTIV